MNEVIIKVTPVYYAIAPNCEVTQFRKEWWKNGIYNVYYPYDNDFGTIGEEF